MGAISRSTKPDQNRKGVADREEAAVGAAEALEEAAVAEASGENRAGSERKKRKWGRISIVEILPPISWNTLIMNCGQNQKFSTVEIRPLSSSSSSSSFIFYALPRALRTLSGVAGDSTHLPIALWMAMITRWVFASE